MVQGQTFAVAGLIEDDSGKRSRWQSLLDRIPIFDSHTIPESRMIPRELVLVVTPEIVQDSEKKKE